MRRIYGDELKKIQIEILDVVNEFCRKNDISYWLDGGTLLGSVRHKGYIPWDDDIDIGMLRADYDKFLNTFNGYNNRYKAYSIENNEQFYFAFGKILDTYTTLYEPDENGNKLSINIDVFVYDNAPDDKKKIKKMFFYRDIYRNLNLLRTLNHKPNGNIIRRVYIYMLRIILKPFPINYFVKKMIKNSKIYTDKQTKKIGNFTGVTKAVCEKSILQNFTEGEFEGKLYKIPTEYDKWLRNFFGDYMELPPIEKRISHHTFKAYM